MKRGSFFAVLAALIFASPSFGTCGTIRTRVTLETLPSAEGGWNIAVDVWNDGDATAYGLRAFVFVDGWIEGFDALGDNPPGGSISLRTRFVPGTRRPGRYTGMVRVHFEDMSGKAHRAHHLFSLICFGSRENKGREAFDVRLDTPPDESSGTIRVRLENRARRTLLIQGYLFLPEGVSTPVPGKKATVGPGEAWVLVFPLTRHVEQIGHLPFHLAAWTELPDVHLSRHVEGRLPPSPDRPLFKAYLLAAAAVLTGVGLVLLVRSRRSR